MKRNSWVFEGPFGCYDLRRMLGSGLWCLTGNITFKPSIAAERFATEGFGGLFLQTCTGSM